MGRLNYDSAPAQNVPTAAAGDSSSLAASTAFVQNAVPAGVVLPYAGPLPPDGWLLCDGSNVSRTTYAKLFAAVGTTYGAGDGTTTFKLPDLRGEFVRGLDNSRGVDTGRTLGSAQAATTVPNAVTGASGGSLTINVQNGEKPVVTSRQQQNWSAGSASPMTDYEARPRNVAMNYIIKFA